MCDPVQDLTYEIPVDIAGVKRSIRVSDFVLPAYFDPAAAGPADFLDRVRALEITAGGYQVAKETYDGRIVWLPEDSAGVGALAAQKNSRVLSRVSRAPSLPLAALW